MQHIQITSVAKKKVSVKTERKGKLNKIWTEVATTGNVEVVLINF